MQFLDPAAPRPVRWLGRFGYAARGLLFFLVGWALVRAGLGGHRIHDVGGALDAIREHRWSFRAITGGLFLFGGFSLLEARYRILPAEKEVIRKVEQGLDEIITPAA